MSGESVVSAWLAAQFAGPPDNLVDGANCRTGPIRKASDNQALVGAVPSACVFVMDTTGINSEAWVDGGARTGLDKPGVIIWVRSAINDYDSGHALAVKIAAFVDKNPPPNYQECRLQGSNALYLQQDSLGHHVWSINLILLLQV